MTVIRLDAARGRLLDGRRSEAFENEIANLRGATAYASDAPRYAPATVSALERDMLGRSRGLRDAVLQLVHLHAAAALASPDGDPLAVLFAVDGVFLGRRLHAALGEAMQDIVAVEAKGLRFDYDDAEGGYSLDARRLPLLMALCEFARFCDVEADARRALDDAFAAAEAAGRSRAAILAASNALGSALNAVLDAMIGERAALERLNRVADVLDRRAEAAGEGEWVVDDEAVLAVWEASAAEPAEHAARNFRTAHARVVALLLAVSLGEDWHAARKGAVAFDQDDARAEALLDRLGRAEGAGGDDGEDPLGTPDLDLLRTPPLSLVRFLMDAEMKRLAVVDGLYRAAPHLPLSTLRSAVVGAHQARITAALRRRAPVAALLAMPDEAPTPYEAQATVWSKTARTLGELRLACAHVVASHNGLDLKAHAEPARRAFRRFAREGFDRALDDPGVGAVFGAAISPLSRLSGRIETIIAVLPADRAALYAADRPRIDAVLARLYAEGGQDEDAHP